MPLRDWHRRILPEAPQWRAQAGLAVLAAGIVVGLAGVALFLAGERLVGGLAWREAAIALAALSVPLLFGGISLALPARWPMRGAALLGAGTTVSTIWLFLVHYPAHFNVAARGLRDEAPTIAALYAIGAALLTGALLAQIVGLSLRRRAEAGEADAWEEGYEVPDWLIERDIDEAMARHPVEWGALPKQAPGVELSVPGFGSGTQVRGRSAARRVRLAMPELEEKSRRLRDLGAAAVQVEAQPLVDATQALGDLRRLQAEHPRRYRPPRPPFWRRWFR